MSLSLPPSKARPEAMCRLGRSSRAGWPLSSPDARLLALPAASCAVSFLPASHIPYGKESAARKGSQGSLRA